MNRRKAMFWNPSGGAVDCFLCPQFCKIPENAAGICGIRQNMGGELFAAGYGLVSSAALDPIEKKPLFMFNPGKNILSIGGFGCNLRCPFCQNSQISIEYDARWQYSQSLTAEQVAELAVETAANRNIGVAYTYNEPLVNYEFLYDCARHVREAGMLNILVTNGFINPEPLEMLLPFIDAMNIDLKGFSDDFYTKLGARRGGVEAVKQTIATAREFCHVEVTTLVIPGENEDEVAPLSEWLASLDENIPLHLNRFYPRFKYSDKMPTPPETLLRLGEIAKTRLTNVFIGNVR
ncbi:MAG: AmmeMemoRadiSam system radical SAM enzyme [Clostridiales bacterium]|jgi:pyruvate formate lyase activating enzyme|nr:AmmeMemoRadiSam system radical SAM enzyme [Clostridiales bacterium]